MSNFTTELIKNLANNVSVEEIFRIELEKAFNQLLETELDCFLGYEKYSKDGYNTGGNGNHVRFQSNWRNVGRWSL